MKDLQDWAAVQKLYKSTKNISYIAETLDMSRTTVYTLLAKSEEPVYQRKSYPCKIEPYKDKIIEWKYSSEYQFNAWHGINTESAQARAFIVIIPSEGIQSIKI